MTENYSLNPISSSIELKYYWPRGDIRLIKPSNKYFRNMDPTTFEAKVKKANNSGTGFIEIPEKFVPHFKIDSYVKMEVKELPFPLHRRIKKWGKVGTYIPKKICSSYNLLGKVIHVSLRKVKGFHTKLGKNGRIYIPKARAEELELKENDIILIRAEIGDSQVKKFCKINKRERKHTTEYSCILSRKFRRKEGTFEIKRKLEKEKAGLSEILKFALKGLDWGRINEDKAIIFYHKKKLKINLSITLEDLVYFMGCFFADGIKRGYSWGITASTFKQANFYHKMHKKLVKNPELHHSISITSKKRPKKGKLFDKWKRRTGIKVNKLQFNKSSSNSELIRPYGSLTMKSYKKIVLIFYNKLLEYTYNFILENNNKKLALDFIGGVLEGDGYPSKSRGHIVIASNKKEIGTSNEKEIGILKKVLKRTGLDFKIYKKKEVRARLNSLGILKNIVFLKNKIFKYYPKRRRKFIRRFCNNVGAVRFLLGKQDYVTSWVKSWMKENNILEGKKLTEKGVRIKNSLLEMEKELK